MFIDLSYFYHFSLLQRLSYSPSRVSCFQKKKKISQHTCVSFQSVFRKYPQWTQESLPSGQRKEAAPRWAIIFTDRLTPFLVEFWIQFHMTQCHIMLCSQQSDKDLAPVRYEKRRQRAQSEAEEVPASCLPQSRQFLLGKGLQMDHSQ